MTALPWHRQEREREGEPGGGEVGGTNGELPQARAALPRVHPQSLNLQLAHPKPERGPAAGTDSLGRLAQGTGSAQSVQWPPKERERERELITHGLIQRAQELGSANGFGATRAGCG